VRGFLRATWKFLAELADAWESLRLLWRIATVLWALGLGGLMSYLTSLEGAPWPVIILVSSAVFALGGIGMMAIVRALGWGRRLIRRMARVHIILRAASQGMMYPSMDIVDTTNVLAIQTNVDGSYTITWAGEFATPQYLVVPPQTRNCRVSVLDQTTMTVRVRITPHLEGGGGEMEFAILADGAYIE
jgi:hypothetical protein